MRLVCHDAPADAGKDDWKVNISGVTEADVDANYQAVITGAQNGTYSTYGPIVLNHELSECCR